MPEQGERIPQSYELYYSSILQPEELDNITETIYQQMVNDEQLTTYPKELVRQWLEKEKCLIALDTGKRYMGGVILKRIPNESPKNEGYTMIGLNIPPQYRRQGIGRNLFETAIKIIPPGMPVLVESINPTVHHLCEENRGKQLSYSIRPQEKQLLKAWEIWKNSYRQIQEELSQYPQNKWKTYWEFAVGMITTAHKYKAFAIFNSL